MKTAQEWGHEFERRGYAFVPYVEDIAAIQADARRELLEVLRRMVDAMRAYEMNVDVPAPQHHRNLMADAEALLADAPKRTEPTAEQIAEAVKQANLAPILQKLGPSPAGRRRPEHG
jgi:dihydroorotate dehydrogenase